MTALQKTSGSYMCSCWLCLGYPKEKHWPSGGSPGYIERLEPLTGSERHDRIVRSPDNCLGQCNRGRPERFVILTLLPPASITAMSNESVVPPVAPLPVLTEADFPALYRLADSMSTSGRDNAFAQTRGYLAALTMGALAGALTWKVGSQDLMGWVSVAAFLLSIILALLLAFFRPAETWYQGRAAAESVKSLTWCYVTGADPFPLTADKVDQRFLARLRQIVQELKHIETTVATGAEITHRMRELRASPFETRRDAYVAGRIEEQRRWYAEKAGFHRKRSRQLISGAALVSIFGLVLGVLRAQQVIAMDLLGVFAAFGAALVAESQLRQHNVNASAYALTFHELGMVSALASTTEEASWPRVVSEAEEAISREHTMWCARNGIITVSNGSSA